MAFRGWRWLLLLGRQNTLAKVWRSRRGGPSVCWQRCCHWSSGKALAPELFFFRYILDNPRVVKGRSVLDLGSGCGATAIAAVMSGASQVLANDIDPIAGMAMILNCELNHLDPFPITIKNIINSEAGNWDLIVLGDMFYDEQLADGLHHWLQKCIRIHQTEVLIGDPGRHQFLSHSIHSQLHKVIEYSLPESTRQENYGLTSSIVWSYQPSNSLDDS
ncbi:hypothetical protein EK904_012845 [Melospiza melodia maxima]|nr:hypothetical protein EK904_012845 [Melospiza melodia maxima]